MAIANLADAATSIETGLDSIVIVDNFQSIRGGFTLDVTGFAPLVIKAGHPIIEETSTGALKPMPVASATAFASLPTGHTYAGVAANTVLTAKPMIGIIVRGTINHVAFTAASVASTPYYYAYTTILTAIKAALPLMDFRGDR